MEKRCLRGEEGLRKQSGHDGSVPAAGHLKIEPGLKRGGRKSRVF